MWPEFIDRLKDAALVAKIQEAFGVKIHYRKCLKDYEKEEKPAEENVDSKSSDYKHLDGKDKQNQYNGYTVIKGRNSDEEVRKKRTILLNDKAGQDEIQTIQGPTHDGPNYTITNYFWYYLFLFGTELGDEIFYSAFIPFWFWNIDGAVGRRVVLVWATVMTVGQILKDIICWPRPACPPAVRLQSKWSQEYGMPSTHAMIGISIPFGVVLYTMNRYIYPLYVGCIIAFLWCALVCMSRLYLGMHTVLDILGGLILAVALMIPLVPLVDATDYYIVSNIWALAILVVISIIIIVYYPCSERWTPTRGDTTMVVSVTTGVHVGAWLNYNTGAMLAPTLPPPYAIMWPSYNMLGRMILRTTLGFCSVVATKAICKTFSYATMCAILKINSKDLMQSNDSVQNSNKILVELVYKYITCFMIGVNTVYLLPNVFTVIGIERPTFYTEM